VNQVLGGHSRKFNIVFDEAQAQMRAILGMEMMELPQKEKVTLQQRKGTLRNNIMHISNVNPNSCTKNGQSCII
jgi:hypothetical protein